MLLYLYSVVMVISFILLFVFARCCRHGRGKEKNMTNRCVLNVLYRGADKFLARPGRKQAYVSVRMT